MTGFQQSWGAAPLHHTLYSLPVFHVPPCMKRDVAPADPGGQGSLPSVLSTCCKWSWLHLRCSTKDDTSQWGLSPRHDKAAETMNGQSSRPLHAWGRSLPPLDEGVGGGKETVPSRGPPAGRTSALAYLLWEFLLLFTCPRPVQPGVGHLRTFSCMART